MEFYCVKNVSKVGDSSLYINIQSGIQNDPVNIGQLAALHQMQPREIFGSYFQKKKIK